MFRIFVLLFLFSTSSVYSEKTPVIIYFKGTCSAGKSTLIRAIQEKYSDIEVIDEDAMVYKTYTDAVQKRFPIAFASIQKAIAPENIYPALRPNQVLFKKTATQQERNEAKKFLNDIQNELNLPQNLVWKQQVSDGITNEIFQKMQVALQNKKSVLIDTWYISSEKIQELYPNTSVIRVLLYSSFPVAYERFLKRNTEAVVQENYEQKRYVRSLISSFYSLYTLSNKPKQPIQVVKRSELEHIFNQILPSLPDDSNDNKQIFTGREISLKKFQEMKDTFMQPFLDYQSETLCISPKEKQDLIIDNSAGDIQKALHAIEQVILSPV